MLPDSLAVVVPLQPLLVFVPECATCCEAQVGVLNGASSKAAEHLCYGCGHSNDLPQLAQATFGELSGGQRQRVLIARALTGGARLLLMDEPFAGVDAASAERLTAIIDRLADQGHAVMIATHDIEQTRDWDLVLCLNRRQVAFGPPGSTLTRRVLEETHGGAIIRLPPPRAGDEPQPAVLPPHHHDEAP